MLFKRQTGFLNTYIYIQGDIIKDAAVVEEMHWQQREPREAKD